MFYVVVAATVTFSILSWYLKRTPQSFHQTYFDMDRLPDELLLLIVSYLEPLEIATLQQTSRRFRKLGRDNQIWKNICFGFSRAEAMRRRQLLFSQSDSRLSRLARAMDSLARSGIAMADPNSPSAEMQAHREQSRRKTAIRANWDPSYPREELNFYQEYLHRHTPIQISWLQSVKGDSEEDYLREAVGMGLLFDDAGRVAEKVIAPMDDGSVSVWDVSYMNRPRKQRTLGRMVHQSSVGILAGHISNVNPQTRFQRTRALMTETGAVECVSIDSRSKKGYFAVMDMLTEIDLNNLQVVSQSRFPHAITALSEARQPTPMTVGTNRTMHLHDPRQHVTVPGLHSSHESIASRCELIGGRTPANSLQTLITGNEARMTYTLPQPGPLSIVHMPATRDWDGNGDIWVAGRFTNLLNFDRRYFPRVRGAVQSGARLSCITAVPHPFIPLELRLSHNDPDRVAIKESKDIPGFTMLAAGEYKLKGSLELYSLSSDPTRNIISSDGNTMRNQNAFYQNRQTASSSKLLSVAPHGGCIVFSDGNGNLTWVERDGFSLVRRFNLNERALSCENQAEPRGSMPVTGNNVSRSDDMVQKIAPMISPSRSGNSDIALGQDNLVIWTGDGKLGVVGFGKRPDFEESDFEEQLLSEDESERVTKQRAYDAEMRRALERQAAELRWMRSYGL